MNRPLLSFCVPVFNAEERIGRCLDSVLVQDIPSSEREILVVDNCSTDRTLSIVEEKLRDVANARVVRNKTNIGRIENWNRCLELATGRYIKFALANDVLLRGAVRQMLYYIEAGTGIGMVCSYPDMVSSVPDQLPHFKQLAEPQECSHVETLALFGKSGNITGGLNGILFDSELIRRNGLLFDPSSPFCADFLFAIALASKSRSVFMNARTYMFDTGAVTRYTFAALEKKDSYFREHRMCSELIRVNLKSLGVRPSTAYHFLFRMILKQEEGGTVSLVCRMLYKSPRLLSKALIVKLNRYMEKNLPKFLYIYRRLKNILLRTRTQVP